MKKTTKQITKMGKLLMVFGVFFSQLSFPLGVLAEELNSNEENNLEEVTENVDQKSSTSEEEPLAPIDPEELPSEEETNYQIFINGEEGTEYTITDEDSKIVNISQTYQGSEEYILDNPIETIDFTTMLYGTYTYEFNVLIENEIVASKTIKIHYLGDNSSILNQYVNTSISYLEGTYVILGNPLETLNTQMVLEQFNVSQLTNDYQATLTIKNDQNEELEALDTVISGYKINLKNDQIEQEYNIEIVGDYNLDGLVDEKDKMDMINGILSAEEISNINDTNRDGFFNILDATHPVFTEQSWENNIVPQDELTNTFQNKEEFYIDEEFEVKYSINGFVNDTLKGIEGTLSYDHELLELVDITIEHVYGNINESGKFVYLLEDYSSNNVLMTLKFKALASGNTEIAINDIIASLGGVEANLQMNSLSTEVTILEYGIGGNPEEDDTDNSETESTPETTTDSSTSASEVMQTVATTSTTGTTYRYVALSSNNDIETLTIDGYDIDFNKDTLEYSIKVKNSVRSLDLNITLSDANATYTVEGNSKFKVGENTVTIVVTAENGETKTYTIKVTREKATEDENEEEETEASSSSKTVIIILIILVIIGLIYVIFKDDEEENEKEKIQNKKGNKK